MQRNEISCNVKICTIDTTLQILFPTLLNFLSSTGVTSALHCDLNKIRRATKNTLKIHTLTFDKFRIDLFSYALNWCALMRLKFNQKMIWKSQIEKALQGLFVPFARVGSGDHVRVLHLLHNKYTGYNWRFIRPIACVGSGDPVRVLRLFHNKYTGYNWRFICTVCTRSIRWSCEGLTSIPQQIHWIQLKVYLYRLHA